MSVNPSYKKIEKGEIQGWVREEIIHLLSPAFFEDPIFFILQSGGRVIKESKRRFAAILPLPDGRKLFFKKDETKGLLESWKYLLLPSKARKEWFIATQARRRNLSVPRPLGWMERVRQGFVKESYYLSEAIEPGITLTEDRVRLESPSLLSILANTIKKVHNAGLYHQDLHAGNILWNGESFFMVDLHRARIFRTVTLDQRLLNISQLFNSLRARWGEKERFQFFNKYFEGESLSSQKREKLLHKVSLTMNRLQKKHWRSRTKRCLRESTEFSVGKEGGCSFFFRKDFPLDQVKRAIENHLHLVRERPFSLVKRSPRVVVSIFDEGERRICVKQFCPVGFFDRFREHFRYSKGLRSWINGNGLRVRGVSSLLPLALVERRSWLGMEEGFFMMETSDRYRGLDRYLLEGFGKLRKKLFIKAFAKWLSQIHQKDIYHKDMKSSNILVSEQEGDWIFYLLDMEDVVLEMKVGEKKLLKSFIQLHTSVHKIITSADRYRFFKEYLRLNPIVKDEKAFLRRLVRESRERGMVYVFPSGG